jgi:hypothetical protein
LRNWVKQLADDPQHPFPGHGQMKPEQLEIASFVSGSFYDERPFLRVYEGATGRFWRKAAARKMSRYGTRVENERAVSSETPEPVIPVSLPRGRGAVYLSMLPAIRKSRTTRWF